MTENSPESLRPGAEPERNGVAQVAKIQDLEVRFSLAGETVYAVNGVSLAVAPREKIALVGESGCGKTVTGLSMLGLLPKNAQAFGSVTVGSLDVFRSSRKELREMRGNEVAVIFQDPMTSLNPVTTIGEQLAETLTAHNPIRMRSARIRSASLLEMVGISGGAARLRSYPHQLSGGQRQRVMIAMAMAVRPKLLIADEPTTALDVTTQAQILEGLCELTEEFGTALLLITHDLSVVARMVERVLVMYAGFVVESAPTALLYKSASHPYTVGLLNAVPKLGAKSSMRKPIDGIVPDGREEPRGCPFAPRCASVLPKCLESMPALLPAEGQSTHLVACHNPVKRNEARTSHTEKLRIGGARTMIEAEQE